MKHLVPKNCCPVILLTMVFFILNVAFASDEIEQIKQAIAKQGASWTAAESWVTQLSKEERKRLCGAIQESADPSKFIELPVIQNLPWNFDWRNNNGNWVTSVKDQNPAGSCWAFSANGQIESWWKLHNNDVNLDIDLSEQFLISCNDSVTANSGYNVGAAFDFLMGMGGVPLESCFPYTANDAPCSNKCENWLDDALTIPGYGYITLDEAIVENIKSAVYRHPASVSFTVYDDFFSYGGGVYEHVTGDVSGGHAVLIVGWNDAEQCWICKNSWGPNWGENGYFRIRWGQCGMGRNVPFIWDELVGGTAMAVSPNQLDLSLVVGDSVVQDITITNNGTGVLEFSTMDYEQLLELWFHPDAFQAWDGLSWWCGNPQIGGYNDEWLQYLDTPPINLSNTTAPRLTWMGLWSIEDPSSAAAPYDGWDGCNVWISVDGGVTFNVAYPTTPEYNCQSLWSFGHPEQGWNMGIGIAGWAGNSGGWQQIDFDLTNYKSENVIIRFAFASDLAQCAVDDPNLIGLLIDDIVVSDGGTIIFEDHANDAQTMHTSGYGEELIVDWLNIINGGAAIQPHGSAKIGVAVNTRLLTPGDYQGLIYVNSNDTSQSRVIVPLNLTLVAPDFDLAVEEVWLPGENLPVLFSVDIGARIRNYGLNDAVDFDVVCTILDEGQAIYSDTAQVPLLLADSTEVVMFRPFLAVDTGGLDFIIEIINFPNDYNAYNSIFYATTNASNFVDGFETDFGYWAFDGGWGFTNTQKRTGDNSAHVNNGIMPYPNNMDATMTFIRGFDLQSIDKAKLKYWEKHYTEQNKDICYVELSGDNLYWSKMDSISGMGPRNWIQREVSLNDFIDQGYEKVWVRFHFISDEKTTSFGVYIDDVEIYPENATDVDENKTTPTIPSAWNLVQNYPNPFNPHTTISYEMPAASKVSLTIYNSLGQKIKTLENLYKAAGYYTVQWDGRTETGEEVSSGIFFYQLKAGDMVLTKKMLLLR